MKVMEMYMCAKFVIIDNLINVSSYRSVVIETFSRLVKIFENELWGVYPSEGNEYDSLRAECSG
jgi:hypothetical protein